MSARIAFLGDVFLGGDAQPYIDAHGDGHQLAGIRHLWADADLVVANHEAALTSHDERLPKADIGRRRSWYRCEPAAARTLAANGIGLVSLANNHVGDFGAAGVLDTMAALDAAGVAHCGAGATDTAARAPVVVPVNGLRVGFLSVMQRYQMYVDEGLYARAGHPGPARLRMSRLGPDIATLRARVDLCVVLVHWGRNYRPVTALQEHLARRIVQAGADLVVGHHPHIAQAVELIDGVPVLYSLGNAAFGTRARYGSVFPPTGLVAVVEAEPHRVADLRLDAIDVDNSVVGYRPRPAVGTTTSPV